jgi:hypothetical protein
MRLLAVGGFVAVLALTAGCARFAIYDNPRQAGEESGIRFYAAKPYILVTENADPEKPDVTVVYLPDLANPQFAQPRTGVGMAKLTMEFSNSILTKFGQETDTKIPELLDSVGSLTKMLADLRRAGPRDLSGAARPAEKFQLYEIAVVDGRTQLIRIVPK